MGHSLEGSISVAPASNFFFFFVCVFFFFLQSGTRVKCGRSHRGRVLLGGKEEGIHCLRDTSLEHKGRLFPL